MEIGRRRLQRIVGEPQRVPGTEDGEARRRADGHPPSAPLSPSGRAFQPGKGELHVV
jgi:hypothetical protein